MPDQIQPSAGGEVTCPHCKRTFTPERLSDRSGRSSGYKCPHCRLLVAADRAQPAA